MQLSKFSKSSHLTGTGYLWYTMWYTNESYSKDHYSCIDLLEFSLFQRNSQKKVCLFFLTSHENGLSVEISFLKMC